MEEKPASWKKLSAVSQASANPGTMDVKMHRSYHLNDEDETEVDMENIAKGKQCRLISLFISYPLGDGPGEGVVSKTSQLK